MRLDTLAALNAERLARRPCILVTDPATGDQRLVRTGDDLSADPLAEALRQGFRTGRSGRAGAAVLTVQVPPLRLIVIGAVHVSQALAPMARGLGFDLTIVDPRTAFATPERFPDAALRAEWPQDALPALGGLDRHTALVCLTHEPRLDDPALEAALASDCLYVGALGSRRTHAKRRERLAAAGVPDAALARIHAPIGLAIGAVSPAEIAVSILAEVIATLRRGPPDHGPPHHGPPA